ncbi:MAG: tetratricopeptide repeat protein [Candidatus Riflebacteria bacterium]|nr:tetratricopeptide repeat protein [Candidatus Riflebacteria bacterium]
MGYSTAEITKKANACLRQGKNKVNAEIALGIACFENGEIEAAIQHYKKALKYHSNSAEAHAGMGISAARTGNLKDAVKHLHKAYELNPDCGLLANWLADAYFDNGDLDKAIEYYSEAISKNATDSNAHNDMADAYRLKGDHQKAFELYQKTLHIDPLDTNAMLEMAQCQVQMNHQDAALSSLETLIKNFPSSRDSATAMVICGTILSRQGDYNVASNWFEQALEFFPFNRPVLFQSAICAMKLGKCDLCIKHLKKILEIDPSDNRAVVLLKKVSAL